MKLTKAKLKNLIKEAVDAVEELENVPDYISHREEYDKWMPDIENLLMRSIELYGDLPREGKEILTRNFEKYFKKWEKDLDTSISSDERYDTEGSDVLDVEGDDDFNIRIEEH